MSNTLKENIWLLSCSVKKQNLALHNYFQSKSHQQTEIGTQVKSNGEKMHLPLIQISLVPGFPANQTGLILIFTSKYVTRAYVCGMLLFSSIKKQTYKVESYEISKYTKNLKTYLHLLTNNTFYI